MKKIILAVLLMFSLPTAWAIEIHDAKAQGLVGEANTGYLAAVRTPASAEVNALINKVNAMRTTQFERTSRKTNTTVAQVSHRFYELAIQKTRPGNYYQDERGTWKKK